MSDTPLTAWRCPVRDHDEIRINHLAATEMTRCLAPHSDGICGLKMSPIGPVSVARFTVNKYGADAAKPSVLLARAVIDGAHERDSLRTRLAAVEAERDALRLKVEATQELGAQLAHHEATVSTARLSRLESLAMEACELADYFDEGREGPVTDEKRARRLEIERAVKEASK